LLQCPDCGATIELATARFCHKCGQFLLPPHIAVEYEDLWEQVRLPKPEIFPKTWVISYDVWMSHDNKKWNSYFLVNKELYDMDYARACDFLIDILRCHVWSSIPNAQQISDDRDGESLAIQFSYVVKDENHFPIVPDVPPFQLMQVAPWREVFPNAPAEEDEPESE